VRVSHSLRTVAGPVDWPLERHILFGPEYRGRLGMPELTSFHEYDPAENIVYVTFPTVHLETRAEIKAHFDHAYEFWRDHCAGRKVYYVVGYDGFSVNLRENEYYAEQMRRILENCAITVVRYGGDALQRTGARLYNMKLHAPSRLYESREEAVAVVRALKSGEMHLEQSGVRV
jgi:hypothetical protein